MGVDAGTINKTRVVVIRGAVEDRDGKPLPGVTVAILGHPELGHTLSRADGNYDLAANGGGQLTVTLEKEGFLASQRSVQTPWKDYVWAPKVTLVALDPVVTKVDLTSAGIQVARGSVVTDEDGTRQAKVLFKPGTQATLLINGQPQPAASLTIRATEYTVGKAGPSSMPAALPPSSGYTYAVELSADEALAAEATSVEFNKPVAMYVDNFLGFPVGAAVPTGYYDRQRGVWVAVKNGRVIQVLSVSDGKASIDLEGEGLPASADALAAVGIDDAELAQLALEYPAGRSLWRVQLEHFSAYDCNWPYGPPPDARLPPGPDNRPLVNDPDEECGSIIGCQDQTLGEAVPIAGTPFTLNYKSDRTPGRRDSTSIRVRLSGATNPVTLKAIRVRITVAGREFNTSYEPGPNLTHVQAWDGLDGYGRPVLGTVPATVYLTYDYWPQYYTTRVDTEASFARAEAMGASVAINREMSSVALFRSWTVPIELWDARGVGLGGWNINVHHSYDLTARRLLLGDGRQRREAALNSTLFGVSGWLR